MASKIITLTMFVLLIAILGAVGQADLNDQRAEAARTCKMVAQGAWPAGYAASKNIDCGEYK